jgi:predicted transcriptional regulator
MYTFSLSGIQVDHYLLSLMRNELLGYDIKTNSYRTTQKGHDFLEIMRQMYELDELNTNIS